MSENTKWIISDIGCLLLLVNITWLSISRRHALNRVAELEDQLGAELAKEAGR